MQEEAEVAHTGLGGRRAQSGRHKGQPGRERGRALVRLAADRPRGEVDSDGGRRKMAYGLMEQ